MKKYSLFICVFLVTLSQYSIHANTPKYFTEPSGKEQDYSCFLDFFTSENPLVHQKAIDFIGSNWVKSYEVLLIETLYFVRKEETRQQLLRILKNKTDLQINGSYNDWYEDVWNRNPTYDKDYFAFKSALHKRIDPKFLKYFKNRENQITIRLDEVRWGGVIQDGIPPLRNPEMITAEKASYLNDADIIFGIEVNGDVRAYPKRILAWHEMFTDTVGNTPVAGVYCTLCGTVILYKTTHNTIEYQLGTSGFLYRSNKLMYDQKTQSLWNTLQGKPVIGPLVNKGIELSYLSVVTTTWKEWKERHPNTKVLSLNTGHKRNYNEGVAYQDYFATDNLMFNIPKLDKRLKNKDEVLVIKDQSGINEILAISSKFLKRNKIYHHKIGNISFVVFTDKSGAHRVYYNEGIQFDNLKKGGKAISIDGENWIVNENYLKNTSTGKKLTRLHSYNAFWFGFQTLYPEAKLIK